MFRVDYGEFGPVAGPIMAANANRIDQALAEGFRPPKRLTVSQWAEEYRRFPDEAPFSGPWRHDVAPELVEMMDALSPGDPCEDVTIMKCAQSGATASAENWIGFISDQAPGPMLFVQSTVTMATEWATMKFWPMVEASPRLNPEKGGTIRALGKAEGDGSTKRFIRFSRSNGFVLLCGANSSAGLRSHTVRYAVLDDLDGWPDDLDGQGSPEVMVDQRLKVYRSQGQSKSLAISTPTIKGGSKIEARMRASDWRRFYLVCPACNSRFVPEWEHLQWPSGEPAKVWMAAPCCGAVIEHWQKAAMKRPDGWLSIEIDGKKPPSVLSEGRFQVWRRRMPRSVKRGFFQDGLIATFQKWEDMAVSFIAAQGDQNKLKAWTNLMRGLPFELKGGVPDYERLMALREQDWGRDRMPAGPIVTTMGVDVQGDGIYYEIVGWADHGENWSLAAGFIPGATDVKMSGAWLDLDALSQRGVQFPGGQVFPIDQECVDGGYHTDAAQAYCARRARRLCVFGRAGWNLPVLGRGEAVRYVMNGQHSGRASKKAEDKAYLVGTFGVKLTWYGWLRTTLKVAADELASGADQQPYGRCHFSRDAPPEWFEQVTAEIVVTKTVNGFPRREWQPMPGRANHWLDCRVYNIAAAEKLMLDSVTEPGWMKLRADRYAPRADMQPDLLDFVAPQAAPAAPPAPESAPSGARGDWLGTGNWNL